MNQSFKIGGFNLQDLMSDIWGGADAIITTEMKYTINVMHLNHPETIPLSPICGKTGFYETSPWCQKVGEPLIQNDAV